MFNNNNTNTNSTKSDHAYSLVTVTSYGEHSNLKFPTKSSITCSVLDTTNDSNRRLSLQACDVLNDLRCKNQLCDSFIRVDDSTEFPVHRAVLSGTLPLTPYSISLTKY